MAAPLVAFRVDASPAIGGGHLGRCLALAEALRRRGARCLFLARPLAAGLAAGIEARGFALAPLAADRDDAAATLDALRAAGGVDWLVVDQYGLDARWEREMRAAAERILAIDDLADRDHDCDAIVDQNLHADPTSRYAGRVPANARRLLGPRYALIDAGFAAVRGSARDAARPVRRVHVCFGGSDPGNATALALRALLSLRRDGLAFDVVLGAANRHREAIEREFSAAPGVAITGAVDDMPARLAATDIAVGAGGVSTWERACLGVPSVVVAIAANQEAGAVALARGGVILYAGTATEAVEARVAAAAATLIDGAELRARLSEASRALVDGRGADRVADAIAPPAIRLRRAGPADADDLFAWRDDPATRRFARDPRPLDRAGHAAWFAATLRDPNRDLLVGEGDEGAVGVLRYDVDGDVATVSIHLVPAMRGRGLGPVLLAAGAAWLREHRPAVRRVSADVLAGNFASHRAFRAAGFAPEATSYRLDLRP